MTTVIELSIVPYAVQLKGVRDARKGPRPICGEGADSEAGLRVTRPGLSHFLAG